MGGKRFGLPRSADVWPYVRRRWLFCSSNGIYIAIFFRSLGTDGCGPTNVKNEEAWRITNYATAAAQEAVLMCDDSMNDRLAEISTVLDNIYEYREELAA